jgi:hypothetical protein
MAQVAKGEGLCGQGKKKVEWIGIV